jgi:hypothetical protein
MSVLRTGGSSHFIRETATILLEKLRSALPGNIPSDFSLENNDGVVAGLKNFRGKYLLISFARSDNEESLMEFGILNKFYKTYMKDLEVITILTDRDYQSALHKMEKNGFKWICLNGSSIDLLEYQYDIRMYPTFLILDRQSRIIADPAPVPSEKLETLISKIIEEEKRGSDLKNR